MSQGRPRPAQTRRQTAGDLWDKPTKPDEDYRLLAKRPGFQRDDYVDFPARAVSEEPEAVGAEMVSEFAKENRNRFEAVKAEEFARRRERSLAASVRELAANARRQGIDLPELGMIERAIDDGRRRLKAAA